MRVVFITMSDIRDVNSHGIYTDLMRKFRDNGHRVTIISPCERRQRLPTSVSEMSDIQLLSVRTLNLQKTNVIEKGIGQVLVERQFKSAIKQYLEDVKADLILYSTPPITLLGIVKFLKRKNPQAQTYLLLKDIFPQNAVDINMLKKTGLRGVLYRYFRKREKDLYRVSDYIGCMSPANVDYLLANNPEITSDRVEVAPNSVEVPLVETAENADNFLAETAESADSVVVSISNTNPTNSKDASRNIRKKYGLPSDKPVFVYGGNLGKPQGIPFLIQCLDANANREDCHFVVVGDGTEYAKLEVWFKTKQPKNVSVFQRLPKEDYDQLVRASDVGLIFLDYRFTIPNYPSRLLSYLIEKKPIIAATDPNCDTGSIAEENGYGYWCPSNNVNAFTNCVDRILVSDLVSMGTKGYQFLVDNYTVDNTYNAIMKHCNTPQNLDH